MKADRFGKPATSFRIMSCDNPECSIHIILFDDDGMPFAQAAMNDEQAREVMQEIQGRLYSKVAMR